MPISHRGARKLSPPRHDAETASQRTKLSSSPIASAHLTLAGQSGILANSLEFQDSMPKDNSDTGPIVLGCLLYTAGSAIQYVTPAYLSELATRLDLNEAQMGSISAAAGSTGDSQQV